MPSHLTTFPQLDPDALPYDPPFHHLKKSDNIRKSEEEHDENGSWYSDFPEIDGTVLLHDLPVFLVKVHSEVPRDKCEGQEDQVGHSQLSHGFILSCGDNIKDLG